MLRSYPAKVAYTELSSHASNHSLLGGPWKELIGSLTEKQQDYIAIYSRSQNTRLPLVFKLTGEQRNKYQQIYDQLSKQYKKRADIALGVPIPTDEDSEKLLDVINWIDANVRYNGRDEINKVPFKWDFEMTGPLTNITDLVVILLRERTQYLEGADRVIHYLKKCLEEKPS